MANGLEDFDIRTIQKNVLASITEQAGILNRNLAIIYRAGWDQWAWEVREGRRPAIDPPKPPLAQKVDMDAEGWAFITQGTTPVCEQPQLPTVPVVEEGTIVINWATRCKSGATVYYTAAPQDRFPIGETTPPVVGPDGEVHIYQRVGSPIGGGWYKLVS